MNKTFFPQEEFAALKETIEAVFNDPSDRNQEQVEVIKISFRNYINKITSRDELIALFNTNFKEAYLELIKNEIINDSPNLQKINTIIDQSISEKAKRLIQDKALLIAMLEKKSYKCEMSINFDKISEWLLGIYLEYVFQEISIFNLKGDTGAYLGFMKKMYIELDNYMSTEVGFIKMRKHSVVLQRMLKLHTLYFNDDNLLEIAKSRSNIINKILLIQNYPINYTFATINSRNKIHIGVYDPFIADRTETYATIPFLHLDKNKFNITLLSERNPANSQLSDYCKSLVDDFIILSNTLIDAVNSIRRLDLDIIIIGCNISAVTNFAHLVFQHKVARIHVANFCNPITTGLGKTDYFLLGNNIKYHNIEKDFTEKLLFTSGSPGCLDMSHCSLEKSELIVSKSTYQIPESSTLFISGAVCYKIIPEMLEIWMNIISLTPGSYLLLHPFNPNWNSKYPEQKFLSLINSFIKKHDIDPMRIKIDRTNFKSRIDLKQFIKIADIYLDTFPYSGFVSMSEALDSALPPVVIQGKSMRGRQAASLLKDLNLENLIAEDPQDYIKKAVTLHNNLIYRNECSNNIALKMADGPNFYNTTQYTSEISKLLMEIKFN